MTPEVMLFNMREVAAGSSVKLVTRELSVKISILKPVKSPWSCAREGLVHMTTALVVLRSCNFTLAGAKSGTEM